MNGLNGTSAAMQGGGHNAGPGMVGMVPPAGHQAELNYIYGVVEELSRQLAENRRATADIVTSLGKVRQRAQEGNLTNEELLAEAAESFASQGPNVDHMISVLCESLEKNKQACEANGTLLAQYMNLLEVILAQLHAYKQKHIQDVCAWHQSYRAQLAEARAENARLREQLWEVQEHAGKCNTMLRDYQRQLDDSVAARQRQINTVSKRQELRFWRRMACSHLDDDDSVWSDDDDMIDVAEKNAMPSDALMHLREQSSSSALGSARQGKDNLDRTENWTEEGVSGLQSGHGFGFLSSSTNSSDHGYKSLLGGHISEEPQQHCEPPRGRQQAPRPVPTEQLQSSESNAVWTKDLSLFDIITRNRGGEKANREADHLNNSNDTENATDRDGNGIPFRLEDDSEAGVPQYNTVVVNLIKAMASTSTAALSVVEAKQRFLQEQSRILSHPISPSDAWHEQNDKTPTSRPTSTSLSATTTRACRLPAAVIRDALVQANLLLQRHIRRAMAPQASRHVAEQIERLYLQDVDARVADAFAHHGRSRSQRGGMRATENAESDGISAVSDDDGDDDYEQWPLQWPNAEERAAHPAEARQYAELAAQVRGTATRRRQLRLRLQRLRVLAGVVGELGLGPARHECVGRGYDVTAEYEQGTEESPGLERDAVRCIQENLVTRDGDVERELERMRMLLVRVAGRLGNVVKSVGDGERRKRKRGKDGRDVTENGLDIDEAEQVDDYEDVDVRQRRKVDALLESL